MKKTLCAILLACVTACLLSGCTNPDSLRLDLSQGYGENIKLIHLNANTDVKQERIDAFVAALSDSKPLEKDFSMFAYYPDYRLVISGKTLVSKEDGFTVADAPGQDSSITAVVDLNGDFVDFYFPGPAPEQSTAIYRSSTAAADFKKLVHYS